MDTNTSSNLLKNNPDEYFRLEKEKQRKNSFKILAIALPAALIIGAGFFFFIDGLLKNNDAYKVAVQDIKTNPGIKIATGGVKDIGFMVSGNVKTTNDSGNAQFTMDVIGHQKDIEVSIWLIKESGSDWDVIEMRYH